MAFHKGDVCFGKERNALLTIACGEKEEINQVLEPYQCGYEVKGTSPLACGIKDLLSRYKKLRSYAADKGVQFSPHSSIEKMFEKKIKGKNTK